MDANFGKLSILTPEEKILLAQISPPQQISTSPFGETIKNVSSDVESAESEGGEGFVPEILTEDDSIPTTKEDADKWVMEKTIELFSAANNISNYDQAFEYWRVVKIDPSQAADYSGLASYFNAFRNNNIFLDESFETNKIAYIDGIISMLMEESNRVSSIPEFEKQAIAELQQETQNAQKTVQQQQISGVGGETSI